MAYDPQQLLVLEEGVEEAQERIEDLSTLSLAFTGNIRINRPIYSFLRALFRAKERSARADYSCIDVLFAGTIEEADYILRYYKSLGYQEVALPGAGRDKKGLGAEEIVGLEFDSVAMLLDTRFYYDEEQHLAAYGPAAEDALRVLYEGISRTREKLCLLVMENEALFGEILSIRTQ
jgi:hypothetical protein